LKEILKRFNMEECKSVSTPMGQKEKLKKKRMDQNLQMKEFIEV